MGCLLILFTFLTTLWLHPFKAIGIKSFCLSNCPKPNSLSKQILQALVAVLFLELFPFSASAQINQDLSAAAPSNAVLTNLEIRDGALQISSAALATKVSGEAVAGYVDFIMATSDLSGKLLKLDTERINTLENGDFSATLDATADPWYSGVGKWYSLS